MLHLPMPNEKELDRFIALYCDNFGVEPDRKEAYDAFCRLIHLIYLTEYYPVRPLGRDNPDILRSPSQYQEARARRQYREQLKAGQQLTTQTISASAGSSTPS